MKKLLKLAVCLLLLCASVALADDGLPQDVAAYFSDDTYQLESHCQIEDYFFVAAKDGQTNILFVFKQSGDGWKYSFRTSTGVPQGDGPLQVHKANFEGSRRLVDNKAYQLPTLSFAVLETREHEFVDISVSYEYRDGCWYLEDVMNRRGREDYWITFDNSTLTYYDEYEAQYPSGRITATVQRDLRYVNLEALPKTIEKARDTLTVAPELPTSAELTAKNIKFAGGKKYSVYAAPDATSYRGANGKAVVSTNSWIQVFGQEGDWILIQYSIDAEHYRFGYIQASSLPKNAVVAPLEFADTIAWTTRNISVTDDPLYAQTAMITLPEGAPVTWLATLGDWAYIESGTGDNLRGFVPSSSLTTDRVFDLRNHPRNDGAVVYQGKLVCHADGTVTLTASPIAVAADTLCVYDTYGEIIARVTKGTGGSFLYTGMLPVGCTSLTLVPLDASGAEIAAGRVTVAW